MREIKFRAWDEKMHIMRYSEWSDEYISLFDFKCYEVGETYNNELDYVLQQYTGLNDKNDKEIYEGDVVKGHWFLQGEKHRFIGEIIYAGHRFMAKGVKQYKGIMIEFNPTFEVIGNIYENPELLGDASCE